MISIIVPAHNEGAVIARTLKPWIDSPGSQEVRVVVACNGCTDDTANTARQFGPTVSVVETDVASKAHALNLGDQYSSDFPRIYADADINISLDAIRVLARRLERGDVLAVAPTPLIDLTGCSIPVRMYYSIRSRLPSANQGFGGSGVYALSEAGRKRFSQFPNVIADDTFVRLQFKPDERETLSVKSTVFPPRMIRQLIAVRTRAHAGTQEIVRRYPELMVNRERSNNRTLIKLFVKPHLWPALLIYCCVNIIARYKAISSFSAGSFNWERDDTSRSAF
jgi:glycosyltransferase involved in cell wall biosynthesis